MDWHKPLNSREFTAWALGVGSGLIWGALVAVLAWCVGTPARGGDTLYLPEHAVVRDAVTSARIGPTSEPGAVAEIQIRNRKVNASRDNGTYHVEWGGVGVQITFHWNAYGSPDTFEIEPPDDLIAVPPTVDVPELSSARVVLYPRKGLGM